MILRWCTTASEPMQRTVDTMAKEIRQAFVEMYKEPVLERFRQEAVSQVPERLADKIPPVPKMGDFNIEMVMKSRYFFC